MGQEETYNKKKSYEKVIELPKKLGPLQPTTLPILHDVFEALYRIHELLKESKPLGHTWYVEKTVTAITKIGFMKNPPFHPLSKVDIMSKGPNDAKVSINEGKWFPIEAYEVLPTFDYGRPAIKKIWLRVDSGESARIKIFGIY